MEPLCSLFLAESLPLFYQNEEGAETEATRIGPWD